MRQIDLQVVATNFRCECWFYGITKFGAADAISISSLEEERVWRIGRITKIGESYSDKSVSLIWIAVHLGEQ